MRVVGSARKGAVADMEGHGTKNVPETRDLDLFEIVVGSKRCGTYAENEERKLGVVY